MRATDRALGGVLLVAGVCAPGLTASPVPIQIPAGTLGDALARLGDGAGISIGISDPGLARQRVAALRGRMPAETAIRRLIKGLGACVLRIDAESYRVDPCAPSRPARQHAAPAPPPVATAPPAAPPSEEPTIVVTASKRQTDARDYAGTAIIISGDDLLSTSRLRGTAAIVARLPTLSSTNLGSGRNKLFIRGVADSSFNGPTQATVGQYLGDVRLNYNAPDPDLTLYDIAQVEVLEGPQGTLYGAGSLGGILRIVPAPVDLNQAHGSIAAGLSTTAHGALGNDVATMLNLPIVAGSIGVRGVFYRSVDGGYIDDPGRGAYDINRTHTIGGRLALTADLGDGWEVTLAGTLQNIDTTDGQYAELGLPRLQHSSAIAEPFDNDYALGSLTITKAWDDLRLVSATSAVRHDVDSTYDFTPDGAAPVLFIQRNKIALYANETRLSHDGSEGRGWVVGSSIVLDEEKLSRTLGPVDAPVRIAGVRNTIADAALFGEATLVVAPRLLFTGGARLSFTQLGGEGLDQPEGAAEPSRRQLRVLPSAALSWRLGWHDATLFARVEQGFRAGGLEVNGDAGSTSVQRFQGDIVSTGELGFRAGQDRAGHLTATATLSYTSWDNIQADLVSMSGEPYSANIGRGRIIGVEARIGWRISQAFDLQASAFLNDSQLIHPAAGFSGSEASQLPNIPVFGSRLALTYSRRLTDRWSLTVAFDGRYVGGSRLGVGPLLNIPQGNYVNAGTDLRIGNDRAGLDLGITNLTDTAANTFSLGDPFRVAERRQITPVRPRTVRLGFDLRF